MFEFVQVTAQYSNAVLVAILPQVSEFSQKLDLPTAQPVRLEQVELFNCDPHKGQVGGWLRLTNGFQFWYYDGYVKGFASPDCYYRLQGGEDLKPFYGSVKMSADEAVRLARDSLRKLGYPETTLYADGTPKVTKPPVINSKVVPRYRVGWIEPEAGGNCLDMEVDADHHRLKSMSMSNPNLWRAPPPVTVEPRTLEPGQAPDFLTNAPAAITSMYHEMFSKKPLSKPEQRMALMAMLPVISEYASKLALSTHLPITTNEVASFDSQFYPNQAYVNLTNGYRFVYCLGYIQEFRASHAFFGVDKLDGRIEDYWGAWRLTESQAVKLARDAVKKLGYSIESLHLDKKPEIKKPIRIGRHDIPRYRIWWQFSLADPEREEDVGILSSTQIEVDADQNCVRGISIYDPSLVRPAAPVFGDGPDVSNHQPAQLKFLTNAPPKP
jgi:hypothetical protein